MNAPLQSVDRALEVLLSFDEHRADWGVTELAEEFGWDKSVAQRLLATLAHRGFLVSQPGTRRYRLGPAPWRLAWLWERRDGLASLARPVLGGLAQRTGYTAILAVPDGVHVRCTEAVDGDHGPVRQYPLVGELYPAHRGAVAWAYFAMLPQESRATLFADRSQEADALHRAFHEIRGAGYAYGEGDPHTAALAVPLPVRTEPVGSLALLGHGVIPQVRHGDLVDELHTAALEIAGLLSPHPRPRRSS